MQVKGATREQLQQALQDANESGGYGGNLIFNRCDPLNTAGTRWAVTLRVKSSGGPGARRSASGRHTPAACWHAHGLFFDALPATAEIRSSAGGHVRVLHPLDNYDDISVGSMMRPAYMSELCDCDELTNSQRYGLKYGPRYSEEVSWG